MSLALHVVLAAPFTLKLTVLCSNFNDLVVDLLPRRR